MTSYLDAAYHVLHQAGQPLRYDSSNPNLGALVNREWILLEKNQRHLVYGQSIQKLGTQLFCLDCGQQKSWNADAVWWDVEKGIRRPGLGRPLPTAGPSQHLPKHPRRPRQAETGQRR